MQRNRLLLFFVLMSLQLFAQRDPWLGTWQVEYITDTSLPAVQMELKIGYSEKGILYPACMKLQSDSFNATYELLLVKKNARQLAISRNKYAVEEKPFSIGETVFLLNGLLDISRDFKGQPVLSVIRMPLKHSLNKIKDSLLAHVKLGERIIDFLENAPLLFNKKDGIPWKDTYSERVLSPSLSPAYFGLLDTIYIPTRDAAIHLSSQNKNDIVSLAANGKMQLEQLYLSRKDYANDVVLDTGVNIVVLFAENFDNGQPSKGKVNFVFGRKKFKLDFSRKDDSAASFIAAKLYFEHDKTKDTYFSDYKTDERNLKKNEKLIGSVKSISKQITLAIWDDAVEDGDTISININNKWIARGFSVKKRVQFLTVTLNPGPNNITFIGDNLGSIPPNTSVLEIIDGKKRKSYLLETVPGEINLLKIFYDFK